MNNSINTIATFLIKHITLHKAVQAEILTAGKNFPETISPDITIYPSYYSIE